MIPSDGECFSGSELDDSDSDIHVSASSND